MRPPRAPKTKHETPSSVTPPLKCARRPVVIISGRNV